MVGLVREFEEVADMQKAEEDAMRMLQGEFTLADYIEQIRMLRKMGPLADVLDKVPGFADAFPNGVQLDESYFVHLEAMISSMTPAERQRPQIITQSRAARIARGSGHRPHDVRNMVAQFSAMKKMMAQMGQSAGLMGKIPGLKKLDQMNQLRKMMEEEGGGGMEGMLAGLKNPFKKKFSRSSRPKPSAATTGRN